MSFEERTYRIPYVNPVGRFLFPPSNPQRILSNGPSVERFEEMAAEFLGAKFAIATSCGTTALFCALRAMGVHGKRVAVPSFTWRSTAEAVAMAGGIPVFHDCGDDFHMVFSLKEGIEAAVVNESFGLPAEYSGWENLRIPVLYDSASAFGAEYGNKGTMGRFGVHCFSLSPTKSLTANEGGLVTCQDAEFANLVRDARRWAGRMTEWNAECAMSGIPSLPDRLDEKRKIWSRYADFCGQVGWGLQHGPAHRKSTAKDFCCVLPSRQERDSLVLALDSAGIETRSYFVPANRFFDEPDPATARELYERSVCLPSWPGVDQDFIMSIIEEHLTCPDGTLQKTNSAIA